MSLGIKKDSVPSKEEGELSDEDDAEENLSNVSKRNIQHSTSNSLNMRRETSSKQIYSRYSENHSRHTDGGSKSKRRDAKSRRAEAEMARRSHRFPYDGGNRFRERTDLRQTTIADSHTPSKIWENRRFRASSVKPANLPRESKPQGPKTLSSADSMLYNSEVSGEGEDELALLEKRQELIRDQLKHLEEEERKANELQESSLDSNTIGLVTAQIEDTETSDHLVTTLPLINENNIGIEEDMDEQELRRLALASSERHNRLLALGPSIANLGFGPGEEISLVDVPDGEPDLPEPEIVLVEEDEECVATDKTVGRSNAVKGKKDASEAPQKTKRAARKKKEKTEVKSTVVSLYNDKAKSKKQKRGESQQAVKQHHRKDTSDKTHGANEWAQECERLRALAVCDRQKAMDQFLKLIDKKLSKEMPVTGTMKDFKRQKNIPVLSDKTDQSKPDVVRKVQGAEVKSKTRKSDKKSGQLHDNYEEVEMDIDSDLEKETIEEKKLPMEKLQLGADFMKAMQPVLPYNFDYQEPIQSISVHHAPMPHHDLFQTMLPPQMHLLPPLPPPPPPPPLPPQDSETLPHDWLFRNPYHGSFPPLAGGSLPPVEGAVTADMVHASIPPHRPYLAESIGQKLHRLREEQEKHDHPLPVFGTTGEAANMAHAQGTHAALPKTTAAQRFVFTNDVQINSSLREKIDYSSLDHFYPEKRAYDEQYLQHELLSVLGVRPGYSPPQDAVEYAYPDRTVLPHHGRLEFTAPEDHSTRPSVRRSSPPAYRDSRNSVARRRSYTDLDWEDKSTDQRREISPLLYSRTRFIQSRSPSPPETSKSITKPKYMSDDSTESSHSANFPKKGTYTLDHGKNRLPYSRYQVNDERNDRSSYSPQPVSRSPRMVKYLRHYGSPSSDTLKRSLSPADAAGGQYEPEAPPNKLSRYGPPPPYIPTSIKTPSGARHNLHSDQDGSRHKVDSDQRGSDSDEDDNLMREKLLATVIVKRKSKLEDLSSCSSPSVASPRYSSVHSESFDSMVLMENGENLSNSPRWQGSAPATYTSQSDDDEEDVKPPPVLSRLNKQSYQPFPLAVLSRAKVDQIDAAGLALSQKELRKQQDSFIQTEPSEMCGKINDGSFEADGPKVHGQSVTRSSEGHFNGQHQSEKIIHPAVMTTEPSLQSLSTSDKPSLAPDISKRLGLSLSQGSISLPQSPPAVLETSGLQKASTSGISQRLGPETSTVSQRLGPETSTVSQRLGPETSTVKQRLGPQVPTKATQRLGPPVSSQVKAAAPTLLSAVPQHLQSVKSSSPTRSVTLKDMNQNSLSSPTSPSSTNDSTNEPSVATSKKLLNVNSATSHGESAGGKPLMVKSYLRSAGQDVVTETQRTASPMNDVPSVSIVSSSQSPGTGVAVPTVSRRQYGQLSQGLPIHPQVVVPLGSSDSEDEEEQGYGFQKKIGMILKDQEQLFQIKKSSSETSQQEFLRKQELYLSVYRQKIEEDQEKVKQLVSKAVKFQKAQLHAEKKRSMLQAKIAELNEQLKVADKLARINKMQKEATEKEIQQITTVRLVKTKTIFAAKQKDVLALGKKLLGPSYVPRLVTVPISSISSQSQNQPLSRAQYIALEKQKLKEKEKEIAERLKKLKESKQIERDMPSTTKPSPVPQSRRIALKPKSQEWIKIDQNAMPDVIIKKRRKSLLDAHPCTTPNIPLTPHSRLRAPSFKEKENKQEEEDVAKDLDKKSAQSGVLQDSTKLFKMPSGTQLLNLCKLQVEKVEKHLKAPKCVTPFNQPFASLSQTQPSSKQMTLYRGTGKSPSVAGMTEQSASLPYSSHLLTFRSYRFSSFFRTKENLGFQSSTFSHKINPHCIFCPYDLQGTCNDDSCKQQHPKDYQLSERELLLDIVSYCPQMAGAKDGATADEIKTCVGSYVDNVLAKRQGKMTIDELCLWLSAEANSTSGKRHPHMISLEARKWKPQPKVETGLSLHLDQRVTLKGAEAINVERMQVVDKDAIINEEDVRYFTADITELLTLEAGIMEDQTNADLWQRLAMKKLTDPNKAQREGLDQALNVLSRGLEVNKENSELWLLYLNLYKRHPDVKDFLQFCQTALEYAPSYDLWFLYLTSLKTFPEKDEACTQALEFLHKTGQQRTKSTDPLRDVRTSMNSSGNGVDQKENNDRLSERPGPISSQELGFKTSRIPVDMEVPGNNCETKNIQKSSETDIDITSHCNREVVGTDVISINSNSQSSCDKCTVVGSVERAESVVSVECVEKSAETIEKPGRSRQILKKRSHQVLEMVLYKAGLNLYAGKFKTALHFLQSVLGLKQAQDPHLRLAELLTTSDLLVLWLTYIYVLEWRHLPPCLYSMSNENPGRLLSKDNINLPWSSKTDLHTSVDNLVNLHQTAMKVWTTGEREPETLTQYSKLVQSLVSLYLSQGRASEAATVCKNVLIDQQLVDIWLVTADLYASSNHNQDAIQVMQDALKALPYNTKLQFHLNLFLASKGDSELALKNLEQFVISHFDAHSRDLHNLDPNLLYCQLLKQEEAFHLQMARLKKDIPNDLHKDTYMWLCYSLLMELQGETTDTIEIYEKSLTQAHSPKDLVVIWQNYISYIKRSGREFKDVRDIICRSIISMPTKRDIPFSSSPTATWVDYSHYNQLVESWLSVLPVEDQVSLMEMCLSFVPGNVQLLLRAVDLCLELKESRRAYSWCKMAAAQVDRPATAAFWKMAVALAHMEGTQREVEQMLIGCVETMPLAVSGWKDFLLFEVSRENLGAIEILLTHCHQLGLNIDGFVATISAT